jgi:hypothetical protein
MLWILGTMLLVAVAVRVTHVQHHLVFVSPMDPISAVHLRFAKRTPETKAALYEASRILR